MTRNRRAGTEDRWFAANGTPKATHGRGKRWMARYVDDTGRERSKMFDRKTDAQRWLDAEVTTRFETGTYVTPEAGRTTVGAVYTSWSATQVHIKQTTARVRRGIWEHRVGPRWGEVAVVDVKASAVRAWAAELVAEGLGAGQVQHVLGLLRQVLGAAVEDSRIPRNPCDGVKLPRRKHSDRGYLTHTQVHMLAATVGYGGEVVRFLAYTGLRWGEMAALRVQDFDMLRRRVNVSRSVSEYPELIFSTPKTHERRSVPFPAVLADELSALMVGKDRDGLVFTAPRGGVLRNGNYRGKVFGPAVRRCQQADDTFPTITLHSLRHTAASLAVSAGANVKAVQRMLGHAKASMTLDIYTDLFDDDLDAVADRLDTAIRSAAEPLRNGPGR